MLYVCMCVSYVWLCGNPDVERVSFLFQLLLKKIPDN